MLAPLLNVNFKNMSVWQKYKQATSQNVNVTGYHLLDKITFHGYVG